MEKNDHIRTFIAISLPDRIKQRLKSLQQQLGTCGIKASWPQTAAMHITLKFLGNVESGRMDLIKKSLGTVTSTIPAFSLSIAGMGVFPSVRNARVLWSGITGQTMILEKIVQDIETLLFQNMGIHKEKKRYLPHLTLARIKQPIAPGKTTHVLQAYKSFQTDTFRVSKIHIYKSELISSGARHEQVFSAKLVE